MIDTYSVFKKIFKRELSGRGKIALYPMGKNGLLAKQMLENMFGVPDVIIIDNTLCKYNPAIIPFSEFEKMDLSAVSVVITTTNPTLNAYFVSELEKLPANINICNVLEPICIENKWAKEYFRQLKDLLNVQSLVGDKKLVRIGCDSDGGYILVDDFNSSMKAYSFGIGGNISWEKDMAERYHMNIQMFDHMIDKLPEENPHFVWEKIGIGGSDQSEQSLLSMKTILDRNGDLENKNLVLKMDVEGAEWEFLSNTDSPILDNFVQMVFELHEMYNLERSEQILECIRKINNTHAAVWLHGNNFSDGQTAEGIIVPWSLEVLFVNKKRYELEKRQTSFPIDLDRPNDPLRKDFILGEW